MRNLSTQPACILREGTWTDFRESVKKVNPELFRIIEQISPDKNYKLIEAEYLYGEKITDMGTICVTDKEGKLARLDAPSVPNSLKEQLSYCPTPLILQLTNSSEVFVDTGERIVPLNIFTPGDLYGLFEAITPLTGCSISPCWSVTSGGRLVFLGAKITDAIAHKRLRTEFGVPITPPQKLSDQWHILKIIGNKATTPPWTSKILLFTKDWLEKREDDIGWLRFHNYLLIASWVQSKYMRSKSELSIMWEAFASAIRAINLKPSHYLLDTLMHFIFLADGAAPGFKAADDSQLVLPSRAVEYAYENIYCLKDYASVILHPHRLGMGGDNAAVYYSLTYPTMLEGTPIIKNPSSIISELREIKVLLTTYEKILESHGVHSHRLKNKRLDYFHTEEDKLGEILPTKNITSSDPSLAKCMERFKGKIFPFQGPFFRGCIRVAFKH